VDTNSAYVNGLVYHSDVISTEQCTVHSVSCNYTTERNLRV